MVFEKLLLFGQTEDLVVQTNNPLVCSFLFKLLQQNDLMVVSVCLLALDNILEKLPLMINELLREGVIDRIQVYGEEKGLGSLGVKTIQKKNSALFIFLLFFYFLSQENISIYIFCFR